MAIPAIAMTGWDWRQVANGVDKLLASKEVETLTDAEARLLRHFATQLRRELSGMKTTE